MMNPTRSKDSARRARRTLALPASLAVLWLAGSVGAQTPCAATADAAFQACRAEALDDLWVQRAKCTNLPTNGALLACNRAAMHDYVEALELCDEVRAERLAVCARLGGGIYHPEVQPRDFVRRIDNPFFPLIPGTTFVYLTSTQDGLERGEFRVTERKRRILGVL